ncbi:MAG: PAS domain S-box protein [Thermodesulfobacteriota bacterium]
MEGVRRFFANMKLSVRLGLGFGLVLALLAVVGLFGLYTQGRLSDLNRKLYEHPFAVKSAVLTLETDIRNIQRSMNALLDATNASARNAALGQVKLFEGEALKAFQTIEARFLGPRVMYLKAKGLFEAWRQTCEQAHGLLRAGKKASAEAVNQNESRQQARLVVLALRDIRDFADNMAASVWTETQAARRQALVLMWVFMGAAVLLGVGFAVFITRSVSGPARQIALDAKALANGDLKHLIAYQSENEIGQTAHSLRRMLSGVIGEGQSIKHGLQVPMWTADRDQTITYLNPAAARIAEAVTGLPEDKIVGRLKVSQALPDRDGLMSQMAGKSLEMDGQGTAEVSFTVEGQEMILLESTSPLTDLEGHLMGVMGVGVDITERKQAGQKLSESEERLRTLMEESFDGIFLQRGGTIVFANQRLHRMLGYQDGELVGKEHWLVYHPDYQELTRRRALARMRGEKVVSDYEVKLLRKDGASFAAEVRAKPITVMGEPGIQVWLRDITERKEAEQVRQEREAELAAIYENAPLIMLLVDQERRVLRINGFGQQFAGAPERELIGLRGGEALRCLNALDDPAGCGFGPECGQCTVRRTVVDTLETGQSHHLVEASLPFMVEGKPTEIFFLVSTTRISVAGKRQVLVSILDITERKKAEQARQEREAELAAIYENAPLILMLVNKERRVLRINGYGQEFAKTTGAEKIRQQCGADLLCMGGELGCLYAAEVLIDCGAGSNCELCLVRRTVLDTLETGQDHHQVEVNLPFEVAGEKKELTFLLSTTRLSFGAEQQALVSLLDITERKKVEQALKEREGLLREVERLTKIGGWEMDLLTRQARWTQGTYDIVEIEPGQPVPGPDEHVSYYLPEYRPVVQEAMRALIEDDQPLDFEAQAHTAEGRLIWVRAVGRAQRRDGQCVRIFGTLQDISERKRAEEELKKSEAHFRYLFENMLNGFAYCQMIFENDVPQDFIYLQVNQNFAKLTGLKDVVGKRVSEVIPGIRQANPEVFEIYGRVAQTGRPEQFETYLPALDMWFAISVYSPQRGYFVAVFDVVTERKKAEEALKASEERFRSLAMLLPEIIFETDTQGRLTFTNQAAAQRTGYSQEDLQRGLTALDMLIPEDRARAVENMKKILAGQELPLREYTAQTKDGSTFPCLLRSAPIMRGGVPVGIRGFVVDISERKEAEERLKASEEQFRRIVETAIEGIWSVDGEYRTVFVNARMAQMLGYSVEEMLGRPVQDFMPAEEWEDNRTKMDQRRRGESGQYERRFRRKDGSLVWCLASVQPISDQKQGFLGAFGMFTDITERKRAEEELKKSEEQFRSTFENAPEGMALIDSQRRFLRVNPMLCQMLGYSPEELLGQSFNRFTHPDDQQSGRDRWQELLTGKAKVNRAEKRFIHKNGQVVWVLASNLALRDDQGRVRYILSHALDITERKQAEEDRRRSEAQVRSVLDASPDMILRFNRQRICTFFKASPLFPTRMTQSVVGQDMATFAPAEIVAERMRLAVEVWQTHQPREHTYSVLVNGQRYFRWAVYVWWSEDEVLATIRDVTERTKLEAQLRQSQKMEAIGTLAGGIAHDFNNILGAIIGYAELALDEVGQDGAAVHELKQVLLAGQRAKNLVRQILSFSREREQEQAPVQVATIVKEVLKLLRPATPSNIDIKTDLADQEAYVMADPVQMHQVIMNLCTNAVQAMESAGGMLEVSLQIVDLDQKEAARYVDLEPGRYQVLSVSDTGVGMDRETLGRIFEPFFTTKEADRGTGLGLSVVHGIALSHGGTVTVYSEPGQGSTFRVYLPVIQGPAPEQAGDQPQTTPGGQERILLVDDEQALVDLGRSFLERLGYRVTATTSSPEALQIFQQDPQAFDLVLTDYTMPHMTGVALAQEMLKVRPELPIIISTGFSHQLTEDKAKAIGIKRMVMKPVLGTRLAHLIREVLNGKS